MHSGYKYLMKTLSEPWNVAAITATSLKLRTKLMQLYIVGQDYAIKPNKKRGPYFNVCLHN